MFGPSTPAATTGVDNSNSNGLAADGMYDPSDWSAPGNEMWYLPPGPAFYHNVADASVSMTAEGVNVGGLDLLDFMTMGDDQGYGVIDGNGF
jgi:hypothetical protein